MADLPIDVSKDLFHRNAALTLASRLRRLSDKLMQGVTSVYQELGVEFEPRWFPVFRLLLESESLSITAIAQELSLTHPAINQVAEQLLKHGLIEASKGDDRRKRMLKLSDKGKTLAQHMEPTWQAIRIANEQLLEEVGGKFLEQLGEIEAAIVSRDMYRRVREIQPRPNSQAASRDSYHIRGYIEDDREAFRTLNHEWLNKYFSVEPTDEEYLLHPEERILATGGAIFIAEDNACTVGTCALLHNQQEFEIAKLAVTASAQGKGIGRALTLAAIEEAKNRGAKVVSLETSPILLRAMKLYESLGFRVVNDIPSAGHPAAGPSAYQRATIWMRLDLDQSLVSAEIKTFTELA